MLQISLTHYIPCSVILYITSFGVRRHVSFTFIMVSVIVHGLCVLYFIALGRHQWRCKKRMPINLGPKSNINTASPKDKDSANIVQMVK